MFVALAGDVPFTSEGDPYGSVLISCRRNIAVAQALRARQFRRGEIVMLYWALILLLVAIVAGALGFGGVAGASAGIAKILFFIFLVLLVISLIAHVSRGRAPW